MPFLSTQLATDARAPSNWWERLLASIETANPSYRGKYHRVSSWLIEFDEEGMPLREIGLDSDGAVVLAGPSKNDYGFWLDTNMRYTDFPGEAVAQDYFEQMWVASGVVAP